MTGLSSSPILYTIYETTNLVNARTYIGKHQTINPNDSYLGSGKLITAAIDKYGEEWFEKTVLFIFDNEDEMDAKEAELVTEDFIKLSTNYNLCPGGKGGWGYVNSTGQNRTEWHQENFESHMKKMSSLGNLKLKELHGDSDFKKNHVTAVRDSILRGNNGEWPKSFLGKSHNEDTKKRLSEKAKLRTGEKSSGFGSMWITNGSENRKIKKNEEIPENWFKGRK